MVLLSRQRACPAPGAAAAVPPCRRRPVKEAAAPPLLRPGRPLVVAARVASRRRLGAAGGAAPRPPEQPQGEEGGDGARRGALEETYLLGGGSSSGSGSRPLSEDDGVDPSSSSLLLLPSLWPRLAARYGDRLVALEDPRAPRDAEDDDNDQETGATAGVSLTFAQLEREIAAFAGGLSRLGLRPGERAALFADGSPRWLVADQGVMRLGCADAVRGASSPPEELAFIAAHSRSAGLIFQDAAAFLRAAPALARARSVVAAPEDADPPAPPPPPPLRAPKFVVFLWGGKGSDEAQREQVRAAARALGVASPASAVVTYRELLLLAAAAEDNANAADGSSAPPPPAPAPILVSPDDLATVVYTSGTTGARPKGCPLTHGNLAYQLQALPPRIGVRPSDVSLALLPPWHVYARVAQYLVLASGGKERYSSALHLKEDLAAVRPAFLVAVPLLLEALHARAAARVAAQRPPSRAAVARLLIASSEAFVVARRRARGLEVAGAGGGPLRRAAAALAALFLWPLHALARLLVWPKVRDGLGVTKAVVSGGASLPPHIDNFFEAAGIELTSGYGLTETSPVLACRSVPGGGGEMGGEKKGRQQQQQPNVRGTVGRPLPGTELRVVDPETLRPLPDGERGLVLARGPGVFAGYLDDPTATAAAFPRLLPPGSEQKGGGGGDEERWFSTGDLGFLVPASAGRATAGCLALSGRAKDTIVLLSGENVEPEAIEGALVVSPLIEHAIVVGQDRRALGALVFPSEEAERRRAELAMAAGAAAAAAAAASRGSSSGTEAEAAAAAALVALEGEIAAEAARLNAGRTGYRPGVERLARVKVAWGAALCAEDGTLTRTFKVRRAAALERHAAVYGRLLAGLRE